MFLVDGKNIRQQIPSLPIAHRFSVDNMLKEIEECVGYGLDKFMLFPAVEDNLKDKTGSYGVDSDNFYLQAVRKIKQEFPQVCLISDVALDPYSSDGHDGLVSDDGVILNDETNDILAEMAVVQAEAGFDIIGPSDMMDHRVEAIRMALDDEGYEHVSIMSYTAKYASAFYGPFRDALDSAPKAGDKKTYQMDPANKREAMIEAELDIDEGADFIMVKPALHYLDIIHLLKESFDTPVAAYHVSGECALLIAAAEKGWLDLESSMNETLLSIRRAGADVIMTYFAKEWAKRNGG
jgi:porphobilinogen synthase